MDTKIPFTRCSVHKLKNMFADNLKTSEELIMTGRIKWNTRTSYHLITV